MAVKIYDKLMNDDDNESTGDRKKRFLRVEAKLNTYYLNKFFLNDLEKSGVKIFELDEIVTYIKENSKFNKFFQFIELNIQRFFEYAEKHIDSSRESINIQKQIENCTSNTRRLSLMKSLGRLAKTRTLSNNIKNYVRTMKYKKMRRMIEEIVNS